MKTNVSTGNAGEHLVMAELLARGHHAAMTDRANPAFDIITRFADRYSSIRVKTSTSTSFQWTAKKDGSIFLDFSPNDPTDFCVLIVMPDAPRNADIYVVPTKVVNSAIQAHRDNYLNTLKRDGGKRKDTGHWVLRLRGNPEQPNYGFDKKWAQYKDAWRLLEDQGSESRVLHAEEREVVETARRRPPRSGPANRTEEMFVREKKLKLFWTDLLKEAGQRTNLHSDVAPWGENWCNAGAGVSGIEFQYLIRQHDGTTRLKIARPNLEENRKIFNALYANRSKIEVTFGKQLEWDAPEGQVRCLIGTRITVGGYRDEGSWAETISAMVDSMVRLERTLTPHIQKAVTTISTREDRDSR